MKKLLILAAIIALSTSASATTVQLIGLENIQAEKVDMVYQVYFGDCTTYWGCEAGSEVAFGISKGSLSFRLQQLNRKYEDKQFTTDSVRKKDSTLYLKFLGYPNECRLILSDKRTVNAVIQPDGGCYS